MGKVNLLSAVPTKLPGPGVGDASTLRSADGLTDAARLGVPSSKPTPRARPETDPNLKDVEIPDSTIKKAKDALDGKGKMDPEDLKLVKDFLDKLPPDKKTILQRMFGKGKWSPEAKATLVSAGLYSVAGVAFLMVMYGTMNPIEAVKKATGDVVDIGEDVGKGLRGIKDFFKGALDFFTSGWGMAIVGVVVGLILLFLFMH